MTADTHTVIDDLARIGLKGPGQVYPNLSVPRLAEMALARNEGTLSVSGALVVHTGRRTGRSPDDKVFVSAENRESTGRIWWGTVNRPIDPAAFDRLFGRISAYLRGRDLFVVDAEAGADSRYGLRVRVITELAWHALFARQLFRRPHHAASPDWTIIAAPRFHADPDIDGTRSEVVVAVDLERCMVLICGTEYAGEIKKVIFTVLNYLLPLRGVLPMHCSANIGAAGDVALFFGLSGTGKTTLSADPARRLIGDDEHAWSDTGVFNLEGGCYAKCINLSQQREPQIWNAIRFGAVAENVVVDPVTGEPDYTDDSITENTRVAYPVEYIDNAELDGIGGHPRAILFLTADAFGVLPPIARLTSAQASYHFLSGYTARLAGTEVGVAHPEATFSTCFGAPFLPLPPQIYAGMLEEKMARHNTRVFLVNTGWAGGPPGIGRRIDLAYTRALVSAAISGQLDHAPTYTDAVFGLHVPAHVDGVPEYLLHPRESWEDRAAYDASARELENRFTQNFRKFEKTG